MTNEAWLSDLSSILESVQQRNPKFRVLIMGVGNTLYGDDGLGPVVVQKLCPTCENKDWIRLIDAGPMPENFTEIVRRFRPDILLLLDSSQPANSPGTIRTLGPDAIQHQGISTHRTSLNLFSKYLLESLDCTIVIITVEAVDVYLKQGLSPPIRRVADRITYELTKLMCR